MATQDDKAAKTPAADDTKQTTAPTRYRILSGGVSGAGGVAHNTGAIVTAEQIGDQERVDKLLAKGAIEVVTDAA